MLWVFYDTARCRLPQKGPLSRIAMVTESDTFDQTIFIRSWPLSHKMYQVSCLGLNLRPHKRKTVYGWLQMIRCDDPRFWSSLLIKRQSWCGCRRLSSSTSQHLSTVLSIITPSLWRCPPRVQTDPVLANLGPPAAEMRTPLRFLKEDGCGHWWPAKESLWRFLSRCSQCCLTRTSHQTTLLNL